MFSSELEMHLSAATFAQNMEGTSPVLKIKNQCGHVCFLPPQHQDIKQRGDTEPEPKKHGRREELLRNP